MHDLRLLLSGLLAEYELLSQRLKLGFQLLDLCYICRVMKLLGLVFLIQFLVVFHQLLFCLVLYLVVRARDVLCNSLLRVGLGRLLGIDWDFIYDVVWNEGFSYLLRGHV